jgi:hybrid cluster-associated redox disulfide protein
MTDIITKDMGIMETIQKYPDVVGVFVAHGLGCIGCAMANFETIEQGAIAHGMDIDALMKDLNESAAEMGSKKE